MEGSGFDAGRRCHNIFPGVMEDGPTILKTWLRQDVRYRQQFVISNSSTWLAAKSSLAEDLNRHSVVGFALRMGEIGEHGINFVMSCTIACIQAFSSQESCPSSP